MIARLRSIATILDPVPERARLAARSALAYLRMEAELAELAFDSRDQDPALAGVRSAASAIRQLTFECGDATVDVEVEPVDSRRRLVGQCSPSASVVVTARWSGGEVTVHADDLGRFTVEVASGPVSLRCVWPDGRLVVETAWLTV